MDRVPQSARFALAGAAGNVAFFLLDKAIFAANPFEWERASGM